MNEWILWFPDEFLLHGRQTPQYLHVCTFTQHVYGELT